MTLPLREYLAQRRADIQAAIKAFRAELAEIDAAEDALDMAAGQPPRSRRQRGSAGSGKKTLKELALEVLADHPDGLEAAMILTVIKAKHGLDVARESMSPQLSRLHQESYLTRDGQTWKLSDWVLDRGKTAPQNDETSGVQPPDVSEDEDVLDLA